MRLYVLEVKSWCEKLQCSEVKNTTFKMDEKFKAAWNENINAYLNWIST